MIDTPDVSGLVEVVARALGRQCGWPDGDLHPLAGFEHAGRVVHLTALARAAITAICPGLLDGTSVCVPREELTDAMPLSDQADPERRPGRSKLVYNKMTRTIDTVRIGQDEATRLLAEQRARFIVTNCRMGDEVTLVQAIASALCSFAQPKESSPSPPAPAGEREKIVAWLRGLPRDEWYPHNFADAIERGDHFHQEKIP